MLDLFLAVTKPLKKCLGGEYFFRATVLVDSVQGALRHVLGQNMKAEGT